MFKIKDFATANAANALCLKTTLKTKQNMDIVNPYSSSNESFGSWLQTNNKSFCNFAAGKKVCMLGPKTNLLLTEDIEANIKQTIEKQQGKKKLIDNSENINSVFVFALDSKDLETLILLSQTRNWAQLFSGVHLRLGCIERSERSERSE